MNFNEPSFKCTKKYIAEIVANFDYNDLSPSEQSGHRFISKLKKVIIENSCFWTEHVAQDEVPGWEFFIEIKSYMNDGRNKTIVGFCFKRNTLQIAAFDKLVT